jgi:DNA gyrase inhibitor GyrI
LRRALRSADGHFKTPCPALGLGTIVGVKSDDSAAGLSIGLTLDVCVTVSEDENDDDGGVTVVIRPPGEYDSYV